MQINSLLGINWKNHIPNSQGRLEGNDLDNLKEILNRRNEFSEVELAQLKGKCINFTESLKSGLEYLKAMQICEPILGSTEKRIAFKDGEENVPGFILSALKKDHPKIDFESELKHITQDEFENMLDAHYSKNELINLKESNESLLMLSVSTLSTNELIAHLGNPALADNKLLRSRLLEKAKFVVDGLDYKNRKDFRTAVELSKVVEGDIANELRYTIFQEEFYNAKDLGLIKGLIKGFLDFFRIALPYWIEVDRKFLYEILREVPSLHISVPENPPDGFWNWINSLTNLKSIELPKSCTTDQFNMLPLTLEGIAMNKCLHIDDTILDHLEKMPLKRVLLSSAPDTQYSGSIENQFTKEGLKRVQNKAQIL